MNSIVIKNSHKVIAELRTKGASQELAEGIIETIQLASLEGEPATRADLSALKSELIMWVVGAQIASLGVLIAIIALLIA